MILCFENVDEPEWTEWEHKYHRNGFLDGKSINQIERFIAKNHFEDNFRTWLSVWRVYIGIALPEIHNKMYDRAKTIHELKIIKTCGISSELLSLIDKSITTLEDSGEKLSRELHISEEFQSTNSLSSIDYIIDRFSYLIENQEFLSQFASELSDESVDPFSFASLGQSILLTLGDAFKDLSLLNQANSDLYSYIVEISNYKLSPKTLSQEIKYYKKVLELAQKAKKIETWTTNKRSLSSDAGKALVNQINELKKKLKLLEIENNSINTRKDQINYSIQKSSFISTKPIEENIKNLYDKKNKFINAIKKTNSLEKELMEKIKNCDKKIIDKENELISLQKIASDKLNEELGNIIAQKEKNDLIIDSIKLEIINLNQKIRV